MAHIREECRRNPTLSFLFHAENVLICRLYESFEIIFLTGDDFVCFACSEAGLGVVSGRFCLGRQNPVGVLAESGAERGIPEGPTHFPT